jgi:KipI family sensor histidine kinase inhibitor
MTRGSPSPRAAAAPRFSMQGEDAVLCSADAGGRLDLDVQRRVWATCRLLAARDDVLEVVPGMNNLLAIFRAPVTDFPSTRRQMLQAWRSAPVDATSGRLVEIDVVYGGPTGEDLEFVARATGLDARTYVELHAGAEYVVYALGSQPGFAYLGGLDPRLAVPRRETPRPRVEQGSVIVGGNQAGVLARTTPSGWHVIGRTELECFDPARDPPALLAPGDRVRFRAKEILA